MISTGMLCSGWLLAGFNTTEQGSGDEARPIIEGAIGATLPASVSEMHYAYESWQDWFLWVRFSIAADDVYPLLERAENLCFELPLVEADDGYFINESSADWWQPETATTFVSGECGTAPYYRIRVDMSDAQVWIVYLQIFSV